METKGNMLMNKYDVGRMLGQGNFAKVYYGRNLQTGESVAIKVIDKEKVLKVGLIDQIKREISVMGLVKHPNIVQLYEVMATKTKIYFVMEYCKGGELFNKVSKGRLKEDVARKYFQQLICAVSSCHGRGIYHRDLKPENLLLDENGNLKVSDFGLSAVVDSQRQDGLLHTTCGTPAYVAPEVIKRKGYDGVKSDIWSCGVVLFVLLTGHLPFQGSNIMDIYRKIAKAEYKCPNFFPPDARRLLSKILDPNPDSRISIARIMATSWFRKRFDLVGNIEKPIFDCGADSKHSEYNNARPPNLNAFDIISLSTGFDLSGLFVSNDQKDEVQFTSKESASSILSKLEDIAHDLRLELIKNDKGCLRLERSNGAVSINVGIFEITPTFHLVEMKMSGGDLIECRRLLRQDMKPALEGIVWAWQGEQEQQQQQ